MKMKTLLTFVLVFVPALLANVARPEAENLNSTFIEFDLGDPAQTHVSTDYKAHVAIHLAELPQGGRPGEPMLPYSLKRVLLPADADLRIVQAYLAVADWRQLPGQHEIAPVSPAVTWADGKPVLDWGDKDTSLIVAGRDSAVYGKDAWFPENPIEIVSVGQFRQWKVAQVKLWRAAYNPVRKTLRMLNSCRLVVSASPGRRNLKDDSTAAVPSASPGTSHFKDDLLSSVVNPQDYETFYGPQADAQPTTVDYVVITTNHTLSYSTKLAGFVAFKQACGYKVKVVTESTVAADDTHYLSGSTADQRANNIRAWLKAHYLNDGFVYVLLIGDPRTSTFNTNRTVPMKMCWPRRGAADGYETAATDMFYAELSSTWDLDGDGYYGEYPGDYGPGGADNLCEVQVGRIPFYLYEFFTDLDSILQKTMDYVSEPGSRSWRKSVLVPAATLDFGPQDNNDDGDAGDPADYPDSSYRSFGDCWGEQVKLEAAAKGFASYTLYERDGCYTDGSAYPLTQCNADIHLGNVTQELLNKNYGFVTWWGHGSPTKAHRFCWTDDSSHPGICSVPSEITWYDFLTSDDCPRLDNTRPSFVAQISCYNAYPEDPCNLAYSLLKNGAVGTFAATNISWAQKGSWARTHAVNYGDNASYGFYIFSYMAQGHFSAASLNYCRQYFGIPTDTAWMNMLDFNLYGDPGISLYSSCGVTPAPPEAYSNIVYIPQNKAKTLQLQASDDGLPSDPGKLTYEISSLPWSGTLTDPSAGPITTWPYTLANNGNLVTYTPNTGYSGIDSFNFRANDGGTPPTAGYSNTTYVSFNIGDCIQTAQTGSETLGSKFLLHTSAHDCRSQAIYPPSRAGRTGIITDLALNILKPPPQTLNNWTIRMKHTGMKHYPGGIHYWLDAAGWTTVYQADELPTAGWYNFHLTTPFYYNGIDSLLVDFSFNNDSRTPLDNGIVQASDPYPEGYCVYACSDSQHGDPLNWTGPFNPTVQTSVYIHLLVPNLKLKYALCKLAGDSNQDTKVNLADYAACALAWLTQPGQPKWNPNCDISIPADAFIDWRDLKVFADNWLAGK